MTASQYSLEQTLPMNLDAERFVLGAILTDSQAFVKVAGTLSPAHFSIEKHRRIFQRMGDLHEAGQSIDRVTLANELMRHGELQSVDGVSYLVTLDDSMPKLYNLENYVGIVLEKALLRRIITLSQDTIDRCTVGGEDAHQILRSIEDGVARLELATADKIQRIEDLESIFTKRAPVSYLLEPELPERAVVCLTGDSESGKTTLACSWARDVIAKGHAALILDRDRNPRERIRERFERLGIHSDHELLRIWDGEQPQEAPQPDSPIVIDWIKRMVAATGKSPLVIVDSLISFFITPNENENDSTAMRALFNRCRAVTKVGGTVAPIHHCNRNGEARGSSDFKPASDQSFFVTNIDSNGGRLLDRITLRPEKSRWGLNETIRIRYANGKMEREQSMTPKTVSVQLLELLKANPGIVSQAFADKAIQNGLGRNRARDFLTDGINDGTIRVDRVGPKHHHYWRGADGSDPQERLE